MSPRNIPEHLSGHCIWSKETSKRYGDGRSFGCSQDNPSLIGSRQASLQDLNPHPTVKECVNGRFTFHQLHPEPVLLAVFVTPAKQAGVSIMQMTRNTLPLTLLEKYSTFMERYRCPKTNLVLVISRLSKLRLHKSSE